MAEPFRPPSRPARRWFRRIVLGLVVIVAVAGALLFWRVRAPLPDTSGTIEVDGLRSRTEIVRDVDEVPHIRAATEADALFGLGYVHAQERLWQMEFQRRVASGRLAEIVGEPGLKADRLLRTVGLARAAREAWPRLDAESRALIEAYVAGINAFLADHRGGSLPVEFAIFRFAPEPWTGEDVVAWQKTMAWLLAANWRDETLRVELSARVGEEAANRLTPAYPPNGPIILPPDAVPPAAGSGAAPPVEPAARPVLPRPRTAPAGESRGSADGVAETLAALNALLCHVCLVTDTVHCKDDAPEECATAMAEKARDTGARTVGLIGFNPAIAEALVHVFGAGNVRITDLNPNNIATTKFGVPVHDGHAYGHDLIKGVDLILATGTMVVNGTGEALLQAAQAAGTRCVLYGVTGAAVCHLAGLERWCFQAQSGVSAPQRKTRT